MSAFKEFISAITEMVRDYLSRNVETATIGIIDSYDAKKGRAQVTPLINNLGGNGEGVEYSPIVDVPVCMMKSKKARMTIPVEKGDTVLLVTIKRDISNWLYKGGKSDPANKNDFDLNNVVAIPCVNPFVFDEGAGEAENTLQVVSDGMSLTMTTNSAILIKNGSCTFEMTDSKVSINGENLTVDA